MHTRRLHWLALGALLASAPGCGPLDAPASATATHAAPLIICDETQPDCGYEPPPPPPPAAPLGLTYTPFTEDGSVQVRWPAVADATWYEVQRFDGASWGPVSSGSATSATVSLPGTGNFRFRVRACNDGGCSAFTEDHTLYARPRADGRVMGLASTSGATLAANSSVEINPLLGFGFDRLRQEVRQDTCVDLTNAQRTTVAGPRKSHSVSIAKTRSTFAQELGLTSSLGISVKFGDFSASYGKKQTLVSKTSSIEETHVLVARLRDEVSQDLLLNPSTYPLTPYWKDQLAAGRSETFRNACGDAFVTALVRGKEVFVTFQLKNQEYTKEELQTKTSELKASLDDWMSTGWSDEKKNSINQTFSSYRVEVAVVSTGSTVAVTSVGLTLTDALDLMRRVEAEDVTNPFTFDFVATDYVPPSDLPAGAVADYRPVYTTLEQLARFDAETSRRCELFDGDLYPDLSFEFTRMAGVLFPTMQPRNDCIHLRATLSTLMQACQTFSRWGECVSPRSSACTVLEDGNTCLAVGERLPVWLETNNFLNLYGYLDTGWSSERKWVTNRTCFTTRALPDLRVKKNYCLSAADCPSERPGVSVLTRSARRVSYSLNRWETTDMQCLYAEAKIERPAYYGGTAIINQDHRIYGLYPYSAIYPY